MEDDHRLQAEVMAAWAEGNADEAVAAMRRLIARALQDACNGLANATGA
jgi:DNA-binding GntR family transcriptional regulator